MLHCRHGLAVATVALLPVTTVLALLMRRHEAKCRSQGILIFNRYAIYPVALLEFIFISMAMMIVIGGGWCVFTDKERRDKSVYQNLGVATGMGAACFFFLCLMISGGRFNPLRLLDRRSESDRVYKSHAILGVGVVLLSAAHGMCKLIIKGPDIAALGMFSGTFVFACLLTGLLGSLSFVRIKYHDIFRIFHIAMAVAYVGAIWHTYGIWITGKPYPGPFFTVLLLGLVAHLLEHGVEALDISILQSAKNFSVVHIGGIDSPYNTARDPSYHVLLRLEIPNKRISAGSSIALLVPSLGFWAHPFTAIAVPEEDKNSVVVSRCTQRKINDTLDDDLVVKSAGSRYASRY